MVIFAVIFVYIIICVFMYFTQKHIEAHQVTMGSLSSNNIYKGIALREEEIVTAQKTGYVNYYAREGERVGVGNLVYTLDESGQLADYMNSENSDNTLTARDLNELKTEILGFKNNFDKEYFSSVYDFKYSVKGTVLKLANANILENIDKINASGMSELISFCRAPSTGIIIYSVDGYEDLTLEQFTSDLYDIKNYEKTQLIENDLVEVGQPVYKISKKEDWSIVIQVDRKKADELLDAEYVKVKFLKNQDISWGEVSSYTNAEGDIFVELTFTNSMVTFCTDRFIDIELILEEDTGLKIPNSAIVQKEFFIIPKEYVIQGGNSSDYGVMLETYAEDGTATTEFIATTIYGETDTEYYIDDMVLRIGNYIIKPESTEKYAISKRGSLTGVYNINKGYADFKQINLLDQNDEYSIVKSNTQYGLNVYDYIVLDATAVEDNEFIY
ncbi:MAG: hypothetical protein HDQ97_08805 [Lachnospiraceae bacterium]|nr:hypothetical protein [Lachnospiraceae bacterium]